MTDPPDRLTTALADRYRLDREIGAGGMATVYLAEDLKHQRKVAVKVLRPDLAASLGQERFLREVTIAANLQHPHILPLHDSGVADGFLYYVMPYVDGQSLRQKLTREGELPVPEAVRILRDVADAMASAHQHGVVHRDIKPENVMLSGRHALVTDFGVAKAVSESTGRQSLTTVGVALGTPTYMAPEQATADPHTDHRADIYAFGVVAYELLTGAPPFTGPTPQAVLAAHLTASAAPIMTTRSSLPPALASLVMQCLEKKPADRPQSADEIVARLETVLTPSGGVTPSDTRPLTGAVPAGRRKRLAWLGLGLVVIAAIGVGFYMRGRSKPAAQNRVVVLPLENRTGNAAWDHMSMLAADYITQSLLATGLLQVVPMTASAAVSTAFREKPAAGATGLPQRVATETGARLAVSGAYYLARDSLRFVIELTDAVGEKLLASLEPVLADTKDPMPGLERLRRGIAGALAAHVDPVWGQSASTRQSPPSYEALKLVQEGQVALFQQLPESQRIFHQAFELDTTYELARLYEGIAFANLGELRAADSLARLSERNRSRLGPLDKLRLAWMRAELNEDHQAAYRAVQAQIDLAPSYAAMQQLAHEANQLNRPAEALRILARIDPTSPEIGARGEAYWTDVTDAHHMLGQHEQELIAARSARSQYPELLSTLVMETHALAALHRAVDVMRLVEESLNAPPKSGDDPRYVAVESGLELLAHHDSAAAEALFGRVVKEFDKTPIAQRDAALNYWGGTSLYSTRRFAEGAEALERGCSDAACRLIWRGIVKARLGHRAEAIAIRDSIRPTDSTYKTFLIETDMFRSLIASALGDKEQAVDELRRMFARGAPFGASFHRTFELVSLRDYPPFQELLRPKN